MDYSNTYKNLLHKQKQQLIYNSLADAMLIETVDRRIEFVNSSFCQLFKLTIAPEDLVGKPTIDSGFASSFLFKNPSKFIYRVEEIIEEAKPVTQEKVVLYDGTTYLRDYFPLIINDTITGHLWLYKPLTIAHLAKASNVHLLPIFKKVLETISVPIAIFDAEKRYLFVNKISLPNADKRKLIIGKTALEYCNYYNLPTNIALQETESISQALDQQTVVRFDEDRITKEGNSIWWQHVLYPISTNEDSNTYVVKYSIDITATKQSTQVLQQTIASYTHVLNQLSEVVVMADDQLRVDFLNKVWEDFGNNAAYENLFGLIGIKNYEFYKQAFAVLGNTVSNAKGRLELAQKDGSKKWFQYHITEGIKSPTNDKGIVAILNDITNEVYLEENLLEVVRREKELNDLKSAFVNMVSHELRTPLAVISSGAEIIQMMLEVGKPISDITPFTTQIITEVERMTAFMNDLLMVSKIEAGKIDFHAEATDLFDFINTIAATSYNPWKDGRQLTITSKGQAQPIAVDTKMLRHILQNLIDNAFKYSSSQPAPTMRVRYSNSYVTISVVDAGIGIHQEDIVKLFASFSRGRNVANIAGTGMGLVVVKYFVQQHGGSITIKSKLDTGTIFSVKLPYNSPADYADIRR
jgi:signal transduction histidine kinase